MNEKIDENLFKDSGVMSISNGLGGWYDNLRDETKSLPILRQIGTGTFSKIGYIS
jgi:hypothetical protein